MCFILPAFIHIYEYDFYQEVVSTFSAVPSCGSGNSFTHIEPRFTSIVDRLMTVLSPNSFKFFIVQFSLECASYRSIVCEQDDESILI